MTKPISLTVGQQFEIERLSRAIDATVDLQQLRDLAKQLLKAWQTQKAATSWVMQQPFSGPVEAAPHQALQHPSWGRDSQSDT